MRGSGRTGLHIAPGDSHPPRGVQHAKKKPAFSCELFFKYGGEGGIDSLRSRLLGPSMGLAPLGQRRRCSKTLPAFLCGQPVRYALSLSNWLSPVVEPRSGNLIPPFSENIKEKSPYFRTSFHLEYGGEGGIRTPDTLPYTHFPGVLLQPLGHLTIFFAA